MSFLRITLFIWGLLLVTTEAGKCDADWFGSDCRYKCRCTDNNCDDNGICKDGSKCSTGWFGPACQYADLAIDSQIKQSGSSDQYPELTDGDENTCVDVSSFKWLTVDWTTSYAFTWMRINLHKTDHANGFEIQFKYKSHTGIITDCSNQKMFLISPTTIDIHCDLDIAVDQVIISWKNVQSICSVYISGGRNVALKQNTSQSTTHYPTYPSSAAVNDELIWSSGNPSCTHTEWESSPHWDLYFTQPQKVNRYVLYNRNEDCCDKRLDGFILESFTNDGSLLFNHKDKQGVKDVYTELSVGVKEPVSQVKITATHVAREGKSILTLCEVQIYGDSQCPKGQYGLECNKTCNCVKDEDCFVSTGGCPSGCAAGFYRDECREECPSSYHGINCLESCNENCINQSCDRVSGKCYGCIDGKQGDFCTKEDSTDGSLGLKIGIGVACTVIVILAVVLGIVLFRRKMICKSKTTEDVRSQNNENVMSGELVESPYEDLYRDGDGYCKPHDHHSPGLKETVSYENTATGHNDSVKKKSKDSKNGRK